MLKAFIREKPSRVLIALKDSDNQWHLSKIAASTGTTYVYVTKFLSDLERKGFVTISSTGKKKVVKLTEKGTAIANLIEELKKKLEEA